PPAVTRSPLPRLAPGTTKRPKEPLRFLDGPPVRCKHRAGCRCEHRPVHPDCSGPLRARPNVGAHALVGEAPYPRDSENVDRSRVPRPQAVHAGRTSCPARTRTDVLATARHELVEDPAERIDDQRQVAVLREEVRARSRNVLGEPLAVAVRDHPIVLTLPDVNRTADGGQVEAPRRNED